MPTLQDMIKRRTNYVNSRIGPSPAAVGFRQDGDYGDPQAIYDWNQKSQALMKEWEGTLSARELSDFQRDAAKNSARIDKTNKYGSLAAKALVGSVAGGAALTAAGVIGAGAGAGGAGASAGAGAGTSALESSLIASGMSTAEASAVAAEVAAATAAEAGVASGVGAASAGGAAAGAGSTLASLAAKYGPVVGDAISKYGPTALKVGAAALPLFADKLAGSGGGGGGGPGGAGGPGGTTSPGMMKGGVLGANGLMGTPQELEAQTNQLAQTRADWANRPNQTDMYGNKTTWASEAVLDPATGQMVNKWTNKIELDPQQQAAVDSEKAIKAGMMSNAQGLLGRAGEAVAQPMDWSKFQEWGKTPQGDDAARQRIEGMLFDRLRPEQEQDTANLEAKVRAMGITRGMPQYDREMQKLRDSQSRSRFDAMQYAGNEMQNQFNRENTSANYQNTLRQNQIAEEESRRLQPTREMNALREGNQVDAPQFGKFGSSASAGGVDYTGQYDNQFGQQQANRASYGAALTNIGTTVGSAVDAYWPDRTGNTTGPAAQPGVMNGGYNSQVGQRRTP